jgi:hypothetical protein
MSQTCRPPKFCYAEMVFPQPVSPGTPCATRLMAMSMEQSRHRASWLSPTEIPRRLPYSLLTVALLASIATLGIVSTPTLHRTTFERYKKARDDDSTTL